MADVKTDETEDIPIGAFYSPRFGGTLGFTFQGFAAALFAFGFIFAPRRGSLGSASCGRLRRCSFYLAGASPVEGTVAG